MTSYRDTLKELKYPAGTCRQQWCCCRQWSSWAEIGSSKTAEGGYVLVTRKKGVRVRWQPHTGWNTGPLSPSQNCKPNACKEHETPFTGVRKSSLNIIAKQIKTKALFFVFRLSHDVTSTNIETSLKEQPMLKSLVCPRLNTKFSTHASLHVSVTEEDPAFLVILVYGKTAVLLILFIVVLILSRLFLLKILLFVHSPILTSGDPPTLCSVCSSDGAVGEGDI